MDLLEMLNRNRDLMWGDPDKPDDDEAVVHLCALAADEITTLRATIEAKDAEIARLKMRVQQLRAIIDDAAEVGWR